MIKEKLKQEAKEWLKTKGQNFGHFPIDCVEAYLAGAEPREKQIQIDAEQIRNLQKTNGALTDRVRELKAQIEKMKRDVFECFGSKYNLLVAKLFTEWEIKEND